MDKSALAQILEETLSSINEASSSIEQLAELSQSQLLEPTLTAHAEQFPQ